MPIGLPNWTRVFACSTPRSSARCATPSASAAAGARKRGVSVDAAEAARGIHGGDVAVARHRRDVPEVEARVADVADLLEEQGLLDEAELGLRDVEPAELRELSPAIVVGLPVAVEREAVGEPRARLLLQLDLVVVEREVHQRDLGRPRTRSAMMLRSTSDVPASIVLPRLRSCWWFHQPSSRMPPGSRSSRASFVSRWFASDQRSFTPEPSGPGTPVRS